MENQRFSISDLMEEIRNSGASGLDEVDYVIMETNGKLSVILNSDNRPLTPKDLDIKAESTRISYIVIENGKLVDINMKRLGLSDMWLKKQLESNGISRISDVFYMGVDENGKVVALPMHKK
ncbi:MAG: DUF421 domain-containing protein [Oscillospiraceae bacterium]